MIVRWIWPSCEYRNGDWGAEPTDAFWVEATRDEAVQAVSPLQGSEARSQLSEASDQCSDSAEKIAQPSRPFGFLVAK
jgi:hypothetical protein